MLNFRNLIVILDVISYCVICKKESEEIVVSKILLSYSGGLDSAVILHWLAERGHEVHAYTAQLGGHNKEFINQPLLNGAKESILVDLRNYWVDEIVCKARRADAIYGKYFLHVALGKIAIAEDMVKYAISKDIKIIAHGAHKGENDYYRLNNYIEHLGRLNNVHIKSYAPWEDEEFKKTFSNRDDLLAYAKKMNIRCETVGTTTLTSEPTILGVNYENGDLLDISKSPKNLINHSKVSVDKQEVYVFFNGGNLTKIVSNQDSYETLFECVCFLDTIGKLFNLGIVDLIEPNINGSKARCVYIQPASTLWHEAHMELENLLLSNSEIEQRNIISIQAGKLVYFGQWYSKEMIHLQMQADKYNQMVTGWVRFLLFPGGFRINGRGQTL